MVISWPLLFIITSTDGVSGAKFGQGSVVLRAAACIDTWWSEEHCTVGGKKAGVESIAGA
jgi:hypothetical protein